MYTRVAIVVHMEAPEVMDEVVRHENCSTREGKSEFHLKQCIIPKIAPANAERHSGISVATSSEKKIMSKANRMALLLPVMALQNRSSGSRVRFGRDISFLVEFLMTRCGLARSSRT